MAGSRRRRTVGSTPSKRKTVATITAVGTFEKRATSETGGQKGRKPERYDLLPVEPLRQIALVFGYGAEKYDDNNWRKGYPWSWSYAAMQRHLNQFWAGENEDKESHLPHLAHAAFHCLALLEYMTQHPEMDDRWMANGGTGSAKLPVK